MRKIRQRLVVLGLLLCSSASPAANFSIGIGFPGAGIGIDLRTYPDFVAVPGYPVYYAPRVNANLFFYDGMFWIYRDDGWYASSWYNGPWGLVEPEYVPEFVLRIPVRYYRQPPGFFAGWRSDAPPRWGEHWGRDWEQRRRGWDRWDRRAVPAPAPLPAYQRQFSGNRYPRQIEQQRSLQQRNYRYQPHEAVVRQHLQEQAVHRAPSPPQQSGAPNERGMRRQDVPRATPTQPEAPLAPHERLQQSGGENTRRPTPIPPPEARPEVQHRRQVAPEVEQRRQEAPRSQVHEQRRVEGNVTPESGRGAGQDQERDRGREQGKGRGRNE